MFLLTASELLATLEERAPSLLMKNKLQKVYSIRVIVYEYE